MMTRVAVAVLVALALMVSILEFSSRASEERAARTTKPPTADILRPAPPVASELDGSGASDLRPAVTF